MVFKRFLDVCFALSALAIVAPLFLFLAIFIKLRSPGPVLFWQSRVGKDGKDFVLLKFRTMHTDNSALHNAATTRRDDERIFRGGTSIRKYKIDELPQIINILWGDMAVVGPRPTVREDYDRMNVAQRRRNSVRPGLTGLAQVNGNTLLNWPERIMLDLEYINNYTISGDVLIILRTISQIASGKADTHPTKDDEWG